MLWLCHACTDFFFFFYRRIGRERHVAVRLANPGAVLGSGLGLGLGAGANPGVGELGGEENDVAQGAQHDCRGTDVDLEDVDGECLGAAGSGLGVGFRFGFGSPCHRRLGRTERRGRKCSSRASTG